NPSGLDMEILAAVVSGTACTLKHTDKEIPWKRHLVLIERGKLDLVSGASFTEERAKYAYFIGPYRAEYLALFVKKGNTAKYKISKFSDIESMDFKIGVDLGATYGPMVDAVLKKIGDRTKTIDNIELNRKKVLAGRIDGYLSYLPDEPMELKKAGIDIEMHPMSLINTGDIYIMLSKKANSKEVRDALQASFDKIKADGTLSAIFKKYSEKYGVAQW
ncbi:MAG: amino acid ABC transporter substrate-binding protein, partial [Bacteroidetes bacterium]|nr:amino acid ABC transporter substrate-binding protein [Bacteroidota bacterium]